MTRVIRAEPPLCSGFERIHKAHSNSVITWSLPYSELPVSFPGTIQDRYILDLQVTTTWVDLPYTYSTWDDSRPVSTASSPMCSSEAHLYIGSNNQITLQGRQANSRDTFSVFEGAEEDDPTGWERAIMSTRYYNVTLFYRCIPSIRKYIIAFIKNLLPFIYSRNVISRQVINTVIMCCRNIV